MARKDPSKAKCAFDLLKANAGRAITIDQMTKATGWEEATVKTYFYRQWKHLLGKGNPRGGFIVKTPFDMTFKDFQAVHSQVPSEPSGELTGCVAFLDILGFREKIAGENFDSVFSAYSAALASAISDESVLGYAAFSDSIVIHTYDNSEEALLAIVRAVSHLMNDFIKLHLPIRGCVSFGKFRRAGGGGNVIIAGRPIVDAYQYELQQEWVGVLLSPTLVQRFRWIRDFRVDHGSWNDQDIEHLVTRFEWVQRVGNATVPFSSNAGTFSGYAILPMPASPATIGAHALLHHIATLMDQLRELSEFAPDPRSQGKYRNSLMWLESHRSGWAMLSYRLGERFPNLQ